MTNESAPGGKLKIEPLPTWTEQECWVWNRVCVGEIADFNQADGYGGKLDPKLKDNWPDNRILRPEFLQTVLLREPYRSALTHNGVRIEGAWFTERLSLSDAILAHPLWLISCRFEVDVDVSRLRSPYLILLNGSKFIGKLDMDSLQLDSHLLMRDKAEFAEVDLGSAKIGGQVDLSTSKLTGNLNMNSLQVEGSLLMRDKAEFAEVDLSSANIRGSLEMDGSRFTRRLNMNSLQVTGNLFMRAGAEFGEVVLTAAKVGDQIDITTGKFSGKLGMNSLQVEGSLLMRDGAEFREVELVSAKVGKTLEMDGSRFTGKLDMDSLEVETHLFMRNASVKDSSSVVLISAKVGSSLDLSGSLLPSLDLTGTVVRGEFRLGQSGLAAKWQEGAGLTIRNTWVGTLQDLPDAWPDELELQGFTYDRLGGYGANSATDMATRNISWLKGWLGKQKKYSPQPYEQLASVLLKSGYKDKANDILYAGKERERGEATWSNWLWLTLLKVFIGYGYRIRFSIYWVLGFIELGAIVLIVSGQGQANRIHDGIAYSFDMLLPIVKLRELHYKIDLAGWARYYFYFHKLMGYVLGSFIVAGLSGLTKK